MFYFSSQLSSQLEAPLTKPLASWTCYLHLAYCYVNASRLFFFFKTMDLQFLFVLGFTNFVVDPAF